MTILDNSIVLSIILRIAINVTSMPTNISPPKKHLTRNRPYIRTDDSGSFLP